MAMSSCGTFCGFTASLSLGRFADCLGGSSNSSARYDLAVVVSRPVSIFLRVLTGFFIFLALSGRITAGRGPVPLVVPPTPIPQLSGTS
jgi:hypothetical protein